MMKSKVACIYGGFAGVLLATATLPAQSTIDETLPYAWSENAGWVNFRPSPDDGVVVTEDYLYGFAWSENVGWIYLGGVPDNGTSYTQGLDDTGVNNLGGSLSGYAWGENIGWINFDTSSEGGSQVSIDSTGQMQGYAWAENIGWINMDSGFGVKDTSGQSGEAGELWMIH